MKLMIEVCRECFCEVDCEFIVNIGDSYISLCEPCYLKYLNEDVDLSEMDLDFDW